MWMTEVVREAKRQLRDVYGLIPSKVVGDEPCFDRVPDGIYRMTFDGKESLVVIAGDRFFFDMKMMEPAR